LKLQPKEKHIWILLPVAGTMLFAVLYLVAAKLYPGGSQVDATAAGFSWTNNYWCTLLDKQTLNGQYNMAQPIAITAMVVLCCTLLFFWFSFPVYLNVGKWLGMIMCVSGVLAVAIGLMLITNLNHDAITNLASLFGLVATTGTFIGLYRAKWYGLFLFGIVNMLLVGLNNYFYHAPGAIQYLPLVQKITFAAFLVWICCIDITIYFLGRRQTVILPEGVAP
jgi:hypothetical protein